MARILSVSYDEPLLRTRHMLLQHSGYDTVSSLGFMASLQHCKEGKFDLFILGHSIPYSDKKQLVEEFRHACPAPIISLRRNSGEQLVDGADYHLEPDPEPLLNLVERVLSGKAAAQ
jgi:DNA-binding response OmpR family regulator